mgnify:CR=1 FL=1
MPDFEVVPLDALPQSFGFPDVPTTAQRHTWIAQQRFLLAYAVCCRLFEAAEKAGISYTILARWRDSNEFEFCKRLELAEAKYLEMYEKSIDEWALVGVNKPIFYKGQQVATIKERSELLAMFRMKKLNPAYRENYQIVVPDLTPLAVLEMMRGAGQASLQEQGKLPPRVVDGEVVEKPTEGGGK